MIKFGTSGFRGVIADNFTKETVQKVAYAVAKISKTDDVIAIGYDNRFMGESFARWTAEVLLGYGKKIKFFTVPVPSPLIAFETLENEFGIMISASHNPYFYNGMKIFQRGGRELTAKQNLRLEKLANHITYNRIKTMTIEEGRLQKQISYSKNFTPYITSILNNVLAGQIKRADLKVYFNAMGGSALEVGKKLLEKLDIETICLGEEVNPNFGFGLPAPYKNNLTAQSVLADKDNTESFGFAVDGDGDRISFIDEKGKFYDCNYISALVYDHLLENGVEGPVVKNCAMTSLLDRIALRHGQKVIMAQVGFKNTAAEMMKSGAVLGAESNGFATSGHVLYKDGLMGAARVMEVLAAQHTTLSKAIKALKKRYDYKCEVVEYAYPFEPSDRARIEKLLFKDKVLPEIKGRKIEKVSYEDGLKIYYENGYWGVLRFSGNENVIRLFSEMETEEECEKVIKVYEKLIGLKTRQV